MSKKKDTSARGKTANPLRLTEAWKRSPAPKEPDAVRYNATCSRCKDMFFGDTQREADARKNGHQCRG